MRNGNDTRRPSGSHGHAPMLIAGNTASRMTRWGALGGILLRRSLFKGV